MEWGGGEEPKFWVDPSMGLWIGVEMMVEEPKFWVDPTRFLGQMLGWWCGVEVRNPNSTPSSIPIWIYPNFGWIHGHIMVDSWGYGVGWR